MPIEGTLPQMAGGPLSRLDLAQGRRFHAAAVERIRTAGCESGSLTADISLDQIARELGVRYVLEGSVRVANKHIRVTGKLIDVETSKHIWSERYDRPIENVFDVQDEITDSIIARLEPEISEAERERARRKPPDNFGAWDLYQHGMWDFLRHNPAGFQTARGLFRQSTELDPSFAPAHAGLALVCFFMIVRGTAPVSSAIFNLATTWCR